MIDEIRSEMGLKIGNKLPLPRMTYSCLSSDIPNLKTTGIAYGSEAIITDQGFKYIFTEKGWIRMPQTLVTHPETMFGI